VKLVVGLEGASKPEVESFDFGASLVTEKDLGLFANRKWYAEGNARILEGDTVPQPHDDEVYAGLRFNDWPRR